MPQSHNADSNAKAALVIIDMISDWEFEDAEKLHPGALSISLPIAKLAHRCRKRGIPVIYANDNLGRWKSDMKALVELSLNSERGKDITTAIVPQHDDYFVLKPKHSIFHHTPLELMLKQLQVERLILTGVASDQCLLTSVSEARMREMQVHVVSDCSASQTKHRHEIVLEQLRTVWKVSVTNSRSLRLSLQNFEFSNVIDSGSGLQD